MGFISLNPMRVSFPSTANTQKMCFPSPLHTQALYWFRFPWHCQSQIYGFHFEISHSPTAQQYASFPSLNLNHPKMSLPLHPQYPSAVLVSSPSALRLPKFMGFISLSPMAQQYVSFPSLNFRHPKYVLPPPWIPPQYPSTRLVSSPSAL